jgi:hypothetical protein
MPLFMQRSLVLNDLSIQAAGLRSISDAIYDLRTYPLPLIDLFFAALRIVTNADTGYAQLVVRPRDWAINYRADLPPLTGTSLRRYPDRLDNFGWLRERPFVDVVAASKISAIYQELVSSPDRRLHLALRRLNLCFMRSQEEDRILDATIALEALLSDAESQEISHKTALRMAALSKLDPLASASPYNVFRHMKTIYSYRSAIVHGASNARKFSSISIPGSDAVSTTDMAIYYLRRLLVVLMSHKRYLDPRIVDAELLLTSEQADVQE